MTLEESVAATLPSIRAAADAGSPEALTLMGRLYETGLTVKRDELIASIYYIRAVRNQSPWAPTLLWKLTRKGDYFPRLSGLASGRDPTAKLIWAELNAIGFDGQLTGEQTVAFLEDAAKQPFHEAVLELGLMRYSGKWIDQNREEGKRLLGQAADAGNREARIRLWMIELHDGPGASATSLVDSLRHAGENGSVLAQGMMGFCYQYGIGTTQNIPSSIHYYRRAAQRGSQSAFNALKEMYGQLRPADPEFQIN
jgi:TPR repeat protein